MPFWFFCNEVLQVQKLHSTLLTYFDCLFVGWPQFWQIMIPKLIIGWLLVNEWDACHIFESGFTGAHQIQSDWIPPGEWSEITQIHNKVLHGTPKPNLISQSYSKVWFNLWYGVNEKAEKLCKIEFGAVYLYSFTYVNNACK